MLTRAERERRRGLLALLACTFLMYGGFFMLVPLISVHYVGNLGFAALAVGAALAARQLVQQGLTLVGGALADRWGAKWLICSGMLLRAVGFAGLAWAHTFPLLLLMCLLAALGGALFDAPRSAAVAALTNEGNRTRYFSITATVGALGMTIGPLAGAALIEASWTLVCFVSALFFAVGGLITAWLLPTVELAGERQPVSRGLGAAARDRRFVMLTALLAGYWFMWVQISISLPLVAQQFAWLTVETPLGTVNMGGVGAIYAINAGLTLALQAPASAVIGWYLRPVPILALGIALMAAALGAVAAISSTAGLLGCVVVFSIGALLVQPVQQSLTATLADPKAVGAYFGFGALALAIGGGVGNFAGGWLYDVAKALEIPALPWLLFGAVGALVALGLVLLDQGQFRAHGGVGASPPIR